MPELKRIKRIKTIWETDMEELNHFIVAYDIDSSSGQTESSDTDTLRRQIRQFVAMQNRDGVMLSESCYLIRTKESIDQVYSLLLKIIPVNIQNYSKLSVTRVCLHTKPAMLATPALKNTRLVESAENPNPEKFGIEYSYLFSED